MTKVNIEIISIGDELLIGQVINTNASWIGNLLIENGMSVHRITVISDSKPDILRSLKDAENRSKLVLVTGGLGPTSDDITKPTVCEFFETS
jgi:nicotinamide-nucleotide amidase